MEMTAGACATMANVLVVLMLALVVDRRGITRTIGKRFTLAYVMVLFIGVVLCVLGSDDGHEGLPAAFTFALFMGGITTAIGTLGSLVFTDSD